MWKLVDCNVIEPIMKKEALTLKYSLKLSHSNGQREEGVDLEVGVNAVCWSISRDYLMGGYTIKNLDTYIFFLSLM